MMNIQILSLVLLGGVALYGQDIRRGLSPVPPWAGPEGRISGEYVYTDIKSGEYVLHYPEDLDSLRRGEEPNSDKYMTVRWARHLSDPVVAVEVQAVAEGFEYIYSISNRHGAKQEIRRFMLVTAGTDYTGTLEHRSERPWTSSPVVPNMRPRFEQSAVPLLGMSNKGMLVWWSGSSQGDTIQPGQTRTGYVLKSEFAPGWTTGYAVGGEPLTAPEGGYPEPIASQLSRVSGPAMEYRSVLTVGPRFPKGTPVDVIANEWASTIRRLQVTGELAESQYAAAILSTLRATAENQVVPATSQSSPQPATAREREIANGLRLALGLK